MYPRMKPESNIFRWTGFDAGQQVVLKLVIKSTRVDSTLSVVSNMISKIDRYLVENLLHTVHRLARCCSDSQSPAAWMEFYVSSSQSEEVMCECI